METNTHIGINGSLQQNRWVNFCHRWLLLIAFFHIVGGVALSFDWPTLLWVNYRAELFAVFNINWSDSLSSAGSVNLTSQLNSQLAITMLTRLLGPTIASWGVLMFFLARQLEVLSRSTQNASQPPSESSIKQYYRTLNALIVATLVWFVLDTSISVEFGMTINLAINLLAALAILLPLIYLRLKGFDKKS